MRRRNRYGISAVAAGALAVAVVGGPAAVADEEAGTAQADPATISMRLTDRGPKFTGPAQVVAGQQLRIVNRSKPRKIGPHTFTLVKESLLPDTPNEGRNCFAPGNICRYVAVAGHKFDLETEETGRRLVKVDARGWDTEFTRKSLGDSWFTDKLGADLSQKVSAAPGTTLHYLCVVHPEMQGKIEVVAGP